MKNKFLGSVYNGLMGKNLLIGVFDSGKGGQFIVEKIRATLPQARIIFKSDPDLFPYGNKSSKVIINRLLHFTKLFDQQNCSIIVIACNTATTNAINHLRRNFPQLKFVGVEPPIKPIAQLTKTGKIAIIGTSATIASARKQYLEASFANQVKLYSIACPGLAELIETDPIPRAETEALLIKFLNRPIAAGVDVVGLACTHYSYLLTQMRSLYEGVTFYDPADAVVRRVVKLAHDFVAEI